MIDIRTMDKQWEASGNPLGEFPDARFNEVLSSMAKLFGGSVNIGAVCVGAPDEVVRARHQMGAALAYLALMYGFTWGMSEEGFDCWEEIADMVAEIASGKARGPAQEPDLLTSDEPTTAPEPPEEDR